MDYLYSSEVWTLPYKMLSQSSQLKCSLLLELNTKI